MRRTGGSESAVRKAIATGRIATEDDGTIDAASADAEWHRSGAAAGDVRARTPPGPPDRRHAGGSRLPRFGRRRRCSRHCGAIGAAGTEPGRGVVDGMTTEGVGSSSLQGTLQFARIPVFGNLRWRSSALRLIGIGMTICARLDDWKRDGGKPRILFSMAGWRWQALRSNGFPSATDARQGSAGSSPSLRRDPFGRLVENRRSLSCGKTWTLGRWRTAGAQSAPSVRSRRPEPCATRSVG